ncbi:hypothetical protein BT69DRAFT_1291706 [Atractiella rhizophila]|nr:hypothetical protein BT69DRAFT_1291894 [Atractiella rhizophila]KAH8930496.1 hypothetical protein BT69DRAFT_1291706 [Atractiella rhizophila]
MVRSPPKRLLEQTCASSETQGFLPANIRTNLIGLMTVREVADTVAKLSKESKKGKRGAIEREGGESMGEGGDVRDMEKQIEHEVWRTYLSKEWAAYNAMFKRFIDRGIAACPLHPFPLLPGTLPANSNNCNIYGIE